MSKHSLIALAIFLGVGIVLFGVLAFFVAPRGGVAGQTPAQDLDAETLRVAKGLYCPICPGVPLDVCDTQACEQWRALIRQKLGEGQSASQIETYFFENYGERVLGAPRAQGLNLLVYALPAFIVGAGAALMYLFVVGRSSLRPQTAAVAAASTADAPAAGAADIRQRIEREMYENE